MICLSCGALFTATRSLGQEQLSATPFQGPMHESAGPLRPDLPACPTGQNILAGGRTDHVAACKTGFCSYDCRSAGLFFTTELGWLDVTQRESTDIAARLVELRTPAIDVIENLDPEVETAARVSIGGQTCDGLGVRARFCEFDNAVSATFLPAAVGDPDQAIHAWDVQVFDLEVMLNSKANEVWDSTLSAGYRLTDYEEGATVLMNNMQLGELDARYFGNGLTGAVELRRQLWTRFGVMANARLSLLFGTERINGSGVTLPPTPIDESFETRYIGETQLGCEYQHPLCGGGYWFARGGYEVQYWSDFVTPVGQSDEAPVIFNGLFLAVGLQR
jgi:hypothetical protein